MAVGVARVAGRRRTPPRRRAGARSPRSAAGRTAARSPPRGHQPLPTGEKWPRRRSGCRSASRSDVEARLAIVGVEPSRSPGHDQRPRRAARSRRSGRLRPRPVARSRDGRLNAESSRPREQADRRGRSASVGLDLGARASQPSRTDAAGAQRGRRRPAAGQRAVNSDAPARRMPAVGRGRDRRPRASIARPWQSSDAGRSSHVPSARRKLRNRSDRRVERVPQEPDVAPGRCPRRPAQPSVAAVEQVDLERPRDVVGARSRGPGRAATRSRAA